jgi:hypothetical protein
MKDDIGMFIYLMVDDFEQIPRAVNTQPQIFVPVGLPFQEAVITVIPEGVHNVLSVVTMLERRFSELDDYLVHRDSITRKDVPDKYDVA